MKIGIMTYFRSNYGAMLQAYALQNTLETFGHSCEIIDFEVRSRRNKSIFASMKDPKRVLIKIFEVIRRGLMRERKCRIGDFHQNQLHISNKAYFSCDDLKSSLSEYDGFICGSDQVWKPSPEIDRNRAFYLGFAEQAETLKMSYAASFGVSSISKSQQEEVSPWINDIPYLSIREETGRAIISEITGRQAEVVLDPTLLLDKEQWALIQGPPMINRPYILVYSTSQRGLFPELVIHIKKVSRLPVVVLSLNALNLIPQADQVIYDAGPLEFISLFANASCVCTNSFHGTAFSIIYRKPFWSVPHNIANSRIADLLQRIGLSARQVNDSNHFPGLPLDIDYSESELLLEQEKIKSKNFLRTALSTPVI